MRNGNRRQAIGLRYDPEYPAPFVTARSSGELAERMTNIAREAGVPVVELGRDVDELFLLDPGELIPESLFTLVAEVFSFIYSVQESR